MAALEASINIGELSDSLNSNMMDSTLNTDQLDNVKAFLHDFAHKYRGFEWSDAKKLKTLSKEKWCR